MLEGKYDEAWKYSASPSKSVIAKLLASKRGIDEKRALEMLEADESQVRTKFFSEFMKGFEKQAKAILDRAHFSEKSRSPERTTVNIEVFGKSRDYLLIMEQGQWRFNFFADLLK
jgi:hypothetical protein